MTERMQRILTALLPAILAGAMLWPVTGTWFFADDFYWMNYARHAAEAPSRILTHRFLNYYRPVINALFTLESFWADVAAFPRHLLNLLLQLVTVALIADWLRRLTRSPVAAMAAAFLFAVGPVQLDSVIWVSGRTDLVALCFLMLSLAFMPRYRPVSTNSAPTLSMGSDTASGAVSLICLILGLLSKETVVLAPAVIYCTDCLEYGAGIGFKQWFRLRRLWVLVSVSGLIVHAAVQMSGDITIAGFETPVTVTGWLGNLAAGIALTLLQYLPGLKPYSYVEAAGTILIMGLSILWMIRIRRPDSSRCLPVAAGFFLAGVLMIPSAAIPFPLLPEPHLTFGRFIIIPALGTALWFAGIFSGMIGTGTRRSVIRAAGIGIAAAMFAFLAVSGVSGSRLKSSSAGTRSG
nr:hypothetical protein [bacterium]